MRHTVLSKHSTKPERIFYEVLKELRVPFKHRWIIDGREVDFLLWDKVAIEIDGHPQDGEKNHFLAERGYTPIHLRNVDVSKDLIMRLIQDLQNV